MDWPALADSIDAVCVSTFSQTVTYTHDPGGTPVVVEIEAAFDAQGERIETLGGLPVSTTGPTLGVHLADFGTPPAQDDEVSVAGIDYVVEEVVPDGPGVGATLHLHLKPS